MITFRDVFEDVIRDNPIFNTFNADDNQMISFGGIPVVQISGCECTRIGSEKGNKHAFCIIYMVHTLSVANSKVHRTPVIMIPQNHPLYPVASSLCDALTKQIASYNVMMS